MHSHMASCSRMLLASCCVFLGGGVSGRSRRCPTLIYGEQRGCRAELDRDGPWVGRGGLVRPALFCDKAATWVWKPLTFFHRTCLFSNRFCFAWSGPLPPAIKRDHAWVEIKQLTQMYIPDMFSVWWLCSWSSLCCPSFVVVFFFHFFFWWSCSSSLCCPSFVVVVFFTLGS